MVEDKVESNDGREIEQDVNVAETSQLSGKKSMKQSENHLKKNLGKEQGDTTVEPTYTCPICGEFSNSKFSSVNAHSLKKHGKQLMLDDDDNVVVVVSKSGKEKEESEEKELLKQEGKKPLTPYGEVEPADVFLRNFLIEFDFKEQFIELLCRKVKRRNALPHPSDLARDIQDMTSGITNPRSANYIAEEYSYDLKDYFKRSKATDKPHSSMGYDVGSHELHNVDHGGFPIREQRRDIPLVDDRRDDGHVKDFRHDSDERRREPKEPDMDQPLTKKDLELWQMQEENRRLREGDGHRNPDGEQSWMRERLIKLEDDLRQRDTDRMQKLEDELKAARNTPPPPVSQAPTGTSKEEVAQMVEREIDARTKKVTLDDVERVAQRVIGDRAALTKGDLLYMESRDKLHLEEKKLDESGKTRDVIGRAISGGFERFGKIVSRMMTEEGGDTGMPVEGYTDQAGKMVQVACPTHLGGCGAVITAPIGSTSVTCGACGKRWTAEPRYIPPKVEEKKPPEEFAPKEKKVIEKSLEDAKEGRIKPLETSDAPAIIPEQTTATPEVTHEPTTIDVPEDVRKVAEGIAIGEATDKLEEELKKKKELEELRQRHEEENERKREISSKKVEETIKSHKESPEKKQWPMIDSNICPICNKKCKSKRGVVLHINEMHPEYER